MRRTTGAPGARRPPREPIAGQDGASRILRPGGLAMRNGVVLALAAVLLGALGLPGPAQGPKEKATKPAVTVGKKAFGKTADGTVVELYVLTNAKGAVAKV